MDYQNKRNAFNNVINNNSTTARDSKKKSISSRISGQSIDNGISRSKIAMDETPNKVEDIDTLKKLKRLQQMEKMGHALSKEQKEFIQRHIEAFNRMQVEYRHRQDNQKSKGHGMEM